MTTVLTLLCCNERMALPTMKFDGAFSGLNVLLEDTVQYLNSDYAPTFDNVRFLAHADGLGPDVAYIDHCATRDFYCLFRAPTCDTRACDAHLTDARAAWRNMTARAQATGVADVIFTPVDALAREGERLRALLPARFASVHMRRGDKLVAARKEWTRLPSAQFYAATLANHSDVFVASDDDDFVEDVRRRMPATRLWTVARNETRNATHTLVARAPNQLAYLTLLTRLLAHGEPFVFSSHSNLPVFALYGVSHSRVVDIEKDGVTPDALDAQRFFCSPPFGSFHGLCEYFPPKYYVVQTISVPTVVFVVAVVLSPVGKLALRVLAVPPLKSVVFAAWMAASCSTLVLNKGLTDQTTPVVLVVVQMAFAVLLASVDVAVDPAPTRRTVAKWLLCVSSVFPVQLLSSMLALQHTTVGAYVIVRNASPLVVMAVEGKACSPRHVVCALGMILGSVLYKCDDVRTTGVGLSLLGLNLVAAAVERVATKRLLDRCSDMTNSWAIFLNNLMFVPVFLGLWTYQQSLLDFRQFHRSVLESNYCYAFLASCVSTAFLAFCGVALQRFVTASTFLACTSFNKAFVVVLAILLFREPTTALALLGLAVNMAGAVGLSWCNEARPTTPDEDDDGVPMTLHRETGPASS